MIIDSPLTFAVKTKNIEILKKCSSGGAFFEIASHFLLKKDSVVYGVAMVDGFAKHIRVQSLKELSSLLTSKYMRSDLGTSFKDCESDLKNGMHVLFVGTPCQIFALKEYLQYKKIDLINLLAIDLFCYGSPNPIYWEKYITEKFPNEKILDVNFRFKKPSWQNYSVKITTNKREYIERSNENIYMLSFLANYTLLDGCFNCKFKGSNRYSDITLGDFWGVERFYPNLFDKNGVSILVVNNQNKKEEILKYLSNCEIAEIKHPISVLENISYNDSSIKPKNYNEFAQSINEIGFLETAQKFITINKVSSIRKIYQKILKISIPKKKRQNIEKNSIGIISDFNYFNYGNRLQNIALKTYIKSKGYAPITIVNFSYKFKRFSSIIVLKRKIGLLLHFYEDYKKQHEIKKADKACGNNKIYYFSLIDPNYKKIQEFSKIIYGSDQIWNHGYNYYNLPFNLGFLGQGINVSKYSYAASMGASYVPKRLDALYKEQLREFKRISVREENLQTYLSNLGHKSDLVCDPVLLLNKDEWDNMINQYSKVKIKEKPFILKYCLNTNANSNDNAVIDLLDKNSKYYYCNQFDFVKLIRESDIILTDSFHALLFCAIYRKKCQFVIRKEMIARFDYLFKILNINLVDNEIIDFEKLDYKKLNSFIEHSKTYLDEILHD